MGVKEDQRQDLENGSTRREGGWGIKIFLLEAFVKVKEFYPKKAITFALLRKHLKKQ